MLSLRNLGAVIATLALAAACPETGDGPPAVDTRPQPSEDDLDGDGVDNAEDGDIDGDDIANAADLDIDGDRIPNEIDDDVDGDGVANADDDEDFGANPDDVDGPWADGDGDGEPNLTDSDDDDDGIPDGVFGVGSCDGVNVAADEAHDCDGYCIELEGGPTPCDDSDGSTPVLPGQGAPDNDGDGIPNPLDPDDDNDGLPDGGDTNPNGNDPCVGLEGPPPASCIDDPGEGEGEPAEGEGEGNPNCSTQTFDPAAPVPPRILLVVDKSGSMNEDAPGFGNSKWFATVDAIDGVAHQIESRVELGLAMYPDGAGAQECTAGASLDQGITLNNADEIVSSLDPYGGATIAAGGTPTAAALLAARAALNSLPAAGGQRAVILATDGGPNCNSSLDPDTCSCVAPGQCVDFPQNCIDDTNAIAAANALNQSGFPVFVLGIDGALNFQQILHALAQAGGTGDFFTVDSGDVLASTIEDIADRVGACRFDLPGAANPDNVSVSVDGAVIGRDTGRANGWDLIDVDTVELFGAACDAAAGATNNVQVQTCF
jgi:hypothetical protein